MDLFSESVLRLDSDFVFKSDKLCLSDKNPKASSPRKQSCRNWTSAVNDALSFTPMPSSEAQRRIEHLLAVEGLVSWEGATCTFTAPEWVTVQGTLTDAEGRPAADHAVRGCRFGAFTRTNDAGEWTTEVDFQEALYDSSPGLVLKQLAALPDGIDSVMLVGHEPTWSSMVNGFTGAIVRYPTAAMACIDLALGSWADIELGRGELRWFVTPKLLG